MVSLCRASVSTARGTGLFALSCMMQCESYICPRRVAKTRAQALALVCPGCSGTILVPGTGSVPATACCPGQCWDSWDQLGTAPQSPALGT